MSVSKAKLEEHASSMLFCTEAKVCGEYRKLNKSTVAESETKKWFPPCSVENEILLLAQSVCMQYECL